MGTAFSYFQAQREQFNHKVGKRVQELENPNQRKKIKLEVGSGDADGEDSIDTALIGDETGGNGDTKGGISIDKTDEETDLEEDLEDEETDFDDDVEEEDLEDEESGLDDDVEDEEIEEEEDLEDEETDFDDDVEEEDLEDEETDFDDDLEDEETEEDDDEDAYDADESNNFSFSNQAQTSNGQADQVNGDWEQFQYGDAENEVPNPSSYNS